MQPIVRHTNSLKKPRSRSSWFRYVWIAAVVALLIVFWTEVFWPNRYVASWIFGQGIYKVQTSEKIVALTFDDGPDPRYTEDIGEILSAAGAKSTFFVMGRHVEQHPDIIQTLMAQGHEIGNHTWNHPSLRMMSPKAIRAELESTDQLLRELGYAAPIPFRSPYGNSLFMLPYVLKQRQQANILWTVQMNDWKPEQPDIMMALLAPEFKPGAIILLHDGDGESEGADRSNTVTVVRQILEKYQAEGYRFVTVSELLANGRPVGHRY